MKENGEGSKKTEEESGGRVRYYVGILFVLAANVLTVVSNYFVKVRSERGGGMRTVGELITPHVDIVIHIGEVLQNPEIISNCLIYSRCM